MNIIIICAFKKQFAVT